MPFSEFQYDCISDNVIREALTYPMLEKINFDTECQYDEFLIGENIDDEMKHAICIARLISLIVNENKKLHPVKLDTFYINSCCSHIPDWHHRIRAAQYLGMTVSFN